LCENEKKLLSNGCFLSVLKHNPICRCVSLKEGYVETMVISVIQSFIDLAQSWPEVEDFVCSVKKTTVIREVSKRHCMSV